MALMHTGWALRLRLPRWDQQAAERLERAGIDLADAPHGVFSQPVRVSLTMGAESEEEARERVCEALRGWTILLPFDFLESAPH
jgi:uncharacterized DUF497 family protein